MILLYADKHGELRVVLTMRAKTLRSCMEHHVVYIVEMNH